MDSLPELARDAKEGASSKARNSLSWLPTPKRCDCGTLCEASRTYDPQQAAFFDGGMAPSWVCPECDTAYRREEPWHE